LFSAFPALAETIPHLDGLWQGSIDHMPAQIEWDVLVEIAPSAEGRLVGTMDLPAQRMKLHLLENIKLDGTQVSFEFERFPGQQVPENRFRFEGQLSSDNQKITGFFLGKAEGYDLHSPFSLKRLGNAGAERPPELKPPSLTVLSDSGDELRSAFNRDKDKLRVVVLLSPTCGSCLNSAHIVEKYLLDAVHDDSLRVYAVWGTALGDEKEENAREATAFLTDPRVTHYWTSSQQVAALFGRALKVQDSLHGWDTFQLFPPGLTWGDTLPAPARFWRINRPMPDELALDGRQLQEQACRSLKSCKP
jgi:hypothetical protein